MLARTIWCLWLQGWTNAPDLVRACVASWRQHNPGWTIRHLSYDSVKTCLPSVLDLENIFDKDLPMDALSDVLRIELLNRFGGVWVDSTLYCLRPLDDWIPDAMPSGFFAFDRPSPDRMLSSWFLAAESGSYLVEAWRRKSFAYWKDRAQRDHYFWFHRLFAELYESDAKFRAIWDATPKISAAGPHCFIPYEEHLLGAVSERHREIVEEARMPVLKLTHKLAHERGDAGTAYRWLCDRVTSGPGLERAAMATEDGIGSAAANTFHNVD
jgi:Capsular polysaccharide synthesis protein